MTSIKPTLTLNEANKVLSTLRSARIAVALKDLDFLINDLDVSIKVMEDRINEAFKV